MKLTPTKLITLIFSIVSLFVLSGCGSTGTASDTQLVGGTPEVVPPVAIITSIQIRPADVTVPKGTTGTYTAIAFYNDNTQEDVSKQVVWISEDASIVSIVSSGDEAGDAESLKVGSTTITASLDEVTSNTAKVIVTDATLQRIIVTPFIEKVASGINVQYTATGIYSDNTHGNLAQWVTWQSSTMPVAIIDAAGIANTLSVGTTNITASFNGVTSNTAALEVTAATITSIQITPADISVPKGTTDTYTAIAYYTDNTSEDITRQATWISGDETIVSIVPTGITAGDALAMTVGNTTVTASFDGVTSNTATVEVTAATLVSIEIVAHDINFPAGTTVYYTALAYYTDLSAIDITETADWSSADTTIATVVMGEVVGVSAGPTNINIEYEGENDSQPITVTEPVITSLLITPPAHSMTAGSHKQYLATAYYNNGTTKNVTKDVAWHSSVPEYAVVSNVFGTQGQAFARSVGTTEISATYDGIPVGNTVTLTVLAVTVTLDSIVVTPADLTVTVESTIGYLAEGHYSNGDVVDITTNVTWASSNTHSATIEATGDLIGVATAVTSGTSTTISATLDGVSGNTALTVDGDCGINKPDYIRIEPDPVNLLKGYQDQIHLIGVWTAANCEREITFDPAAVWNTDDQDISSMGSKGGLIFGHEVGTTNVNAKYRARTDSAPVNVTD